MPTRKQLTRFVKKRNKAEFQSNLQFQSDAEDCGFSVKDLGTVQPFLLDGFKGYRWVLKTSGGDTATLVEFGSTIYLLDDGSPESATMSRLMQRAKDVEAEAG